MIWHVNTSVLIDIDELRVGMFIQLGMGWINHPFPTSSFRVSSEEQIAILRELGISQVRHVPGKSVPQSPESDALGLDAAMTMAGPGPGTEQEAQALEEESQEGLAQAPWSLEDAVFERCARRYEEATGVYGAVTSLVLTAPDLVRLQVDAVVGSCVADLVQSGDRALYLLAHMQGQRLAQHSVNTMVLALLLARALGQGAAQLQDVGVAALLHDLGKIMLPPHIGEPGAPLSAADLPRYQNHVGLSVELGQRMGLAAEVLEAISQHHEMADGSGFPQQLKFAALVRGGQILALVNAYDRLCNPLHGASALTPHEALSHLFARQRGQFDAVVLGAFIRTMGVYPPGTLVQLTDGRYGQVLVSAPAASPLRPGVLVHDERVPRGQARVLALARHPGLGVSRSVKAAQLPRAAFDYLSPQPRSSYFFEHVRHVDAGEGGA